jgi:nucleotide-binding universal stress UspA family protein
MLRIQKLLCPVDFFPASRSAAAVAIELAKIFRARLLFLHVLEGFSPWVLSVPEDTTEVMKVATAKAEKELTKLSLQARAARVHAETLVRIGWVDVAVETLVRAQKVDFVIMGTHGRRGLERLFIGSTAERLLRRLNVPVLTIRKPKSGPLAIRNILLATDFSEDTSEAAQYAVFLAKSFGAKLHLLHVVDGAEASISGAYRKLEKLIPPRAKVDVSVLVEAGRPSQRILPIAKAAAADLIIMNVHAKTLRERMTLGSTAETIIRNAAIPVLTIPSA